MVLRSLNRRNGGKHRRSMRGGAAGPEEANMNKKLVKAVYMNDRNTLEALLLEKDTNVDSADEYNQTALHFAAAMGHLSIANLLLQAGATVDAVNDNGRTALHWAAMKGKIEVVEALLKAGANKDSTTNPGQTALHFAAINGKIEVVKALLNAGANKDLKTKNLDQTALDYAQIRNHPAIVKLLRD